MKCCYISIYVYWLLQWNNKYSVYIYQLWECVWYIWFRYCMLAILLLRYEGRGVLVIMSWNRVIPYCKLCPLYLIHAIVQTHGFPNRIELLFDVSHPPEIGFSAGAFLQGRMKLYMNIWVYDIDTNYIYIDKNY